MPFRRAVILAFVGLSIATAGEAVIDLPASVQVVGPDNYRAQLTLTGALLPGDEPGRDLGLDFTCAKGDQRGGTGRAPKWNQAQHAVAPPTEMIVTDTAMTGTLAVTLVSDGYVPNQDRTPTAATVTLTATIRPLTTMPSDENLAQEGQFWKIYPRSQGAVFEVEGTYTLTVAGREGRREGLLGGYLSRPVAPGCWDMGTWDGGVGFTFELGDRRQNWNHARLSQYEFPGGTVDLSRFGGLRLAVRSPRPRADGSVTVWLREADGSWYYVKDAVPLVDDGNGAELPWEDFEEAEWVSPTNHMDEDFSLDTKAISHLGIGVVNPLGIGRVEFTLTAIDGLPPVPAADPAQVVVGGRTLAVNGYRTIPVGLFGGYAPWLPPGFRPGCQRELDFGCGSGVTIPRLRAATLGNGGVLDAPALAAALVAQIDAGTAPGAGIGALLGEKGVKRLRDLARSTGKDRDLVALLDGVIRRAEFTAAAAWEGVVLPEPLRGRLAAAAAADPVARIRLGRSLLAAAYPDLVAEPPATDPSEQFILDCKGERFSPAIYLQKDDWEADLRGRGQRFGETCLATGHVGHLEFWNEPYLNWAERSRVNYQVKFYREDLARENGEVSVKRADGALDIIPHLRWVKARGDKVSQHNGLMIVDETAFSYWSGRANGYLYDRMYTAYAGGVKAAYPAARCIAGWGFRWHEDHWAAWDLLYRPTIDRNIGLIDGIHEHHYQGDTADMVGSYEVLVAYGVTAHGKWLLCYNTETNDLVDAPARGGVDVPENVAKSLNQNYRRCIYNLRDIIYCAAQAPDKAAGRTMIHWSSTREGSAACFELLYDLRGRLIEGGSSDPQVWVVAAVDGTDPAAPRPDGQRVLTTILFNNHRADRPVAVSLALPAGTVAAGPAQMTRLGYDPATGGFAVHREEAVDLTAVRDLVLPGRGAWKIAVPLTGGIPAADQVVRTQYFSPDLLKTVGRETPFLTTVRLDATALAGARRAWLRLVVEDLSPGEGQVVILNRVNGPLRLLDLPKARTRDNGNRIVELPIELEHLTAETTVCFQTVPGNHAGYRVDMTSIMLEKLTE